MRNRVVIIAGILIMYGLVWALFTQSNAPAGDGVNTLQTPGTIHAPEITITANGKKVSLSDYKGKVVLLDFWATWCGPCRMSIPDVVDVFAKYKDRGFQVIGPAMENGGGEKIPAAVKSMQMTYPVGLPTSQDAVTAYGADQIPLMVLVDKKGMVRWHQNGYGPGMEKRLGQYVETLLAE